MARPRRALAALEQGVILLTRHRQLVQVQGDGCETCVDLQGRRVVGAEELAAGFQHPAADRPLRREVLDAVEDDLEVLQGCEAGNRLRRTPGACGRAIHRSSEFSWLGPL